MFEDWAGLYDSVYTAKGKDYAEEVRYLLRWMGPPPAVRVSPSLAEERAQGVTPSARRSLDTVAPEFQAGPANSSTHFIPGVEESEPPTVLDVACGTGSHLLHLGEQFRLFGVDSSPEMLAVARKKLPGASLFLSDMTNFDLGRTFDVVTCLFSSIGYLPSELALERAIGKMADHLDENGVLLIEPPIPPERLHPPETTTLRFTHGGRPWERETSASTDGERLHIRFVYRALAEPTKQGSHMSGSFQPGSGPGEIKPPPVEIVDDHPIRLFSEGQILGAMERAGLEVECDSRGPTGLGLYVGRRQG